MSTKTVRRAVATALGTLAVAAVLPAGIASATAVPGQVCILNQNTWVRATEGGSVLYTLDAGSGFRVDHLNHQQTWIFGHGNGHSDGWIPNDGRC
jgi:hypothetical protein